MFERVHRLRTGRSVAKRVDDIVIGFLTRITDELVEPLSQSFLSGPWSANPQLKSQALAAGFKLTEKQDCRHFVSQGVVEVLSAALFFQVLRSYFAGLPELLGGTSPTTPSALCSAVEASFGDAMAESGDYESILSLTVVGRWVLQEAPQPAIQHWLALLAFVQQLDVSELTGDVLGTIFERLISPERRHAMGQHYTQPRLARSMAMWGVRNASDGVIDPACGAGTFLVETRARHLALGATHDDSLERTYGNDLDPFAAHLAAINLATRRIRRGANYPMVRRGDAFDLSPGTTMLSVHTSGGVDVTRQLADIDLVITNPPFAERHSDEAYASGKVGSLLAPKNRTLPAMRRANLAAWFLLLAAGLAPKTRLAFVLPIPVWQNENLEEWRAWVRRYFDIIVWYTEEDIWFSDARQGVCVGLFEPRPTSDSTAPSGALKFVCIQEPVTGELFKVDDVPVPSTAVVISDISACDPAADPIVEATTPQALRKFAALSTTTRLSDVSGCEVSSGQKLGHDFFKLKDSAPDRKAAVRDVTGLGLQFRIPDKFVTPLLSTPKELETGEVGDSGTCLLTLPKSRPTSKQVHAYLKLGESQDVHRAPSVASRGKSWWHLNPRTADIAIPNHSQFTNPLGWFSTPGVANNNFHVASLTDRVHAEVVAACLASAFGALSRLYVSCEVGCEGARWLTRNQVRSWFVLDPERISTTHGDNVLEAYRALRRLPHQELDHMEPPVEEAFRNLTVAVAVAAHQSRSELALAAADSAVRDAQATVRRRRRRETLALAGRTRAAGRAGERLAVRIGRWLARSDDYTELLRLLTCGENVIKLRSVEETRQGSIFEMNDAPPLLTGAEEELLIERLGEAFVCSPPDAFSGDGGHAVVAAIDAVYGQVIQEFNGEPPIDGMPRSATEQAALETWQQISEEILALVRRQLRRDVRTELGL